MSKVIIFGGSFNPVHMGHVFAACYLSHLGIFDEVLVIPVHVHAYSKKLVSYHHRYEMCRMAMGWIPKVTISDIERQISNDQPNYTCDTAAALKELHPDWDLYFAVGSDNAVEIKNWTGGEKLLSLAKPYVLGRSGNCDNRNIAVLPKISSTEIRDSIRNPVNGVSEIAEAFLPAGIMQYIINNGLYATRFIGSDI